MSNTYYFKTLLTLAALMGMTACGGGGDSGSTPLPPPPAAPASFSFPVVATTTTPQGCVREDGKPGVSAVTYTQQNLAGDFDLVVLRCDSSSGQRILLAQSGITPTLHYIDAAGTVVASRGSTLFAMLPGSTQEIELVAGGSQFLIGFVGVFNNRVLYAASHTGHAIDLHSVTISQTPTTTVVGNAFGGMQVHDRPIGGRVLFATVGAFSPFVTEYRSVRPDGTDPLLLRTGLAPGPNSSLPFPLHVLGDREVIYSEIAPSTLLPSIRMLAIDTPGSDLLIAEASGVLGQFLTVPGAPDRFVFLGRYPNTAAPVLTDVNAERGNLTIRMLQLDGALRPIGFSQGRLYIEGALPPMPNLLRGWVSWLGEGRTAPLTVLTSLWAAYAVTDRAIVYSRSPFLSNGTQFARSDLDGSNERMGSFANSTNSGVHTRAGERIYYLVLPDHVNSHVAALDLATGIETVVYRPNPPQDHIRFFRVGGRLIIWRPAIGADPGWIDSVDLDGNDLRRLDQSPDILEAKPF